MYRHHANAIRGILEHLAKVEKISSHPYTKYYVMRDPNFMYRNTNSPYIETNLPGTYVKLLLYLEERIACGNIEDLFPEENFPMNKSSTDWIDYMRKTSDNLTITEIYPNPPNGRIDNLIQIIRKSVNEI